MALFGQANFHVTDQLTLIAGGRLLREETTADKVRRDVVLNLTDSASAEKSDDAIVWRGGVQYRFNDDVMAFATATRGYKGGGFDTNIGISTLPNVEPEEPIEFRDRPAHDRVRQATDRELHGVQDQGRRLPDLGARSRSSASSTSATPRRTRRVSSSIWSRGRSRSTTSRSALSGAYIDAQWGNFPNAACFQGQTAAQGCVAGVQNLTDQPLPFARRVDLQRLHVVLDAARRRLVSARRRSERELSRHGRLQFPNSPFTIQSGYALLGRLGVVRRERPQLEGVAVGQEPGR